MTPHNDNAVDVTRHRALLIFDLDGALFCLDASLVRECVWLPELTPVEEAPPYIAGIFSLRGQIVPVTDLSRRFGHPVRHYKVSDQVVVLELDRMHMGLIVTEVREVIEVPSAAIQPPPQFDLEARIHPHLVQGEVRVGDEIVTLLDAVRLAQLPDDMVVPFAEGAWPAGCFCPESTPAEHAVFRERARTFVEAVAEDEGVRLPLAVVELAGEYFGIELHAVQEFCNIAHPTPIPCCPPHILGAMSLRGNLFTLLDVRAALNLPRAAQGGGKAVIARLGEQTVGMAVDEVHDVIYLRQEELQAPPAMLREQRGAEIKGTAPYAGRMMALLDLPALLAREEWVVNEKA